MFSEVSSTIQKGVSGAESIFEQLDEDPEVDRGTIERDRVSGRLEVQDLSFVYPGTDKPVLESVSFKAEPGQMIALVGRSGSGKSTLANLIPPIIHTLMPKEWLMLWAEHTENNMIVIL